MDAEGEQLGVLSREDALRKAEEAELDLVLIAPQASPPVARLLNLSKFIYEQDKRKKREKQNKERPPHQLRMWPNIAPHDQEVKLQAARRFLAKGEKVKFIVRMRGRERAHPELSQALLARLIAQLEECGKLDGEIRREGSGYVAMMLPLKPAHKSSGPASE